LIVLLVWRVARTSVRRHVLLFVLLIGIFFFEHLCPTIGDDTDVLHGVVRDVAPDSCLVILAADREVDGQLGLPGGGWLAGLNGGAAAGLPRRRGGSVAGGSGTAGRGCGLGVGCWSGAADEGKRGGGVEERGERRTERRRGRREEGLTLNLLIFSLSVSLIYRGVTIANGLSPWVYPPIEA
jgi:hypothetical protein